MPETIVIDEELSIERTLAADTILVAASDEPEDPDVPWNATCKLKAYNIDDPTIKLFGEGAETNITIPVTGPYRITVIPNKMPFSGTLRIG